MTDFLEALKASESVREIYEGMVGCYIAINFLAEQSNPDFGQFYKSISKVENKCSRSIKEAQRYLATLMLKQSISAFYLERLSTSLIKSRRIPEQLRNAVETEFEKFEEQIDESGLLDTDDLDDGAFWNRCFELLSEEDRALFRIAIGDVRGEFFKLFRTIGEEISYSREQFRWAVELENGGEVGGSKIVGVNPAWNKSQTEAALLAKEWLEVPSTHGGPIRTQPQVLRWLIENGPSTHVDLCTGAELDWSTDPRDVARKSVKRINERATKYGELWEILPENNQYVTIEMKRP